MVLLSFVILSAKPAAKLLAKPSSAERHQNERPANSLAADGEFFVGHRLSP